MPDLALLAITRVALGVGIGLLIAERLDPGSRKAAGLALIAVGAVTTVPLAIEAFGRQRSSGNE